MMDFDFPDMMSSYNKGANGAETFNQGWLSPAISAIGSGFGAYTGLKGLGLAEENLDFQKDSWQQNFAMMQDQYYRKLNNRRANALITDGMSQAELQGLQSHYDSGTNMEGVSYQPGGSAFVNNIASPAIDAPSIANASMMEQATGVAPYSPTAAQSMFNASAATQGVPAGVDARTTALGRDGAIRRRKERGQEVPNRPTVNP